VWGYTPRELKGYNFIAARRKTQDMADQIELQTMAARGDPDKIKKQVSKMRRE
jgi:hypothetical protein